MSYLSRVRAAARRPGPCVCYRPAPAAPAPAPAEPPPAAPRAAWVAPAPLVYVSTRRGADALRGSRTALRGGRIPVWAVFQTVDAALSWVAARSLERLAALAVL